MRNGTRVALLFFVLGFCACLLLIALVRSLSTFDEFFPLKKVNNSIEAVYYPVGQCPDCKKISFRYWKVDKLNDGNNTHLEAARKMGRTPFNTNAEFELKKDLLVKSGAMVELVDAQTYHIKKLSHSYPFLVPSAVKLLNEIGMRFEAKLDSIGIAPHVMQISSVLRTGESQNGLGSRNYNAVTMSAHLFGSTFDITYKEFLQQNGKPAKEGFCRHDMMRHVLAEVLSEMRAEGRCKVVIERKQACFHVTVSS